MIVMNIDEYIRQCKKVGFISDLCPNNAPDVGGISERIYIDLTFVGYTYSDVLMLHFSDKFLGFTDDTWGRIVDQNPNLTLSSHDELLVNRMKHGNLTPTQVLDWSNLLEYWFTQNLGSEQEELPRVLIDVLRDTDIRDHPSLCAFLGGHMSTVGDYSSEYYRYCEMLSDSSGSPFLGYYLDDYQLSVIEQVLLDADGESPTFVDYNMNQNLVPWNASLVIQSDDISPKLEDTAYHTFLSNKIPITESEKKSFDDIIFVLYSSQNQKQNTLPYSEHITNRVLRYLILGDCEYSVYDLKEAIDRWGTYTLRDLLFERLQLTLNLERGSFVSLATHLDNINILFDIFHLLPHPIQLQYDGGINLANIAVINSPRRSVFYMCKTPITRLAVLSKMTNWEVTGGGSLLGDFVCDFVKEIPEIFGRFLNNMHLNDKELKIFTFDQLNEMVKYTTNADIILEWKYRL